MKKPTKREIEKLAQELFSIRNAVGAHAWRIPEIQRGWRRVAEYVLANYTKIEAPAKSCKFVRGKAVCS